VTAIRLNQNQPPGQRRFQRKLEVFEIFSALMVRQHEAIENARHCQLRIRLVAKQLGPVQFHLINLRGGRFHQSQSNDSKEGSMKRSMISMMAVAMFIATLSVASVSAQNAGDLAVSIPFEFAAGGKTLPAGDYYVRRSFDGSRTIMRLVSKSDSVSVYLATHAVQTNNIQNDSKLVFNKYGQQLFLAQVWSAGRSTGEELNKSGRERGLQRELARLSGKPETVSVAVRSN
jgi:hypothetical protein